MITNQTKDYNGHHIATAFHDAGGKDMVIFCHGYRGTSIGPSRFFVRAANKLEKSGISSLRFDQYGSGNSDGDFIDSSFDDWVATTKVIVDDYASQGYRVALFGQSMGSSTVICVASGNPAVKALVAWVPDASVEEPGFGPDETVEEGGQIVKGQYWHEAHDAKIDDKLRAVTAPTYIVQCTADEYVDQQNRDAISSNAQPQHEVENFEGYRHSNWTHEQSEQIINKSIEFLTKQFK